MPDAAGTPVLTDGAIEGAVAARVVKKDGSVIEVDADELQSVLKDSGFEGAEVILQNDLTGDVSLIIKIGCTLDLGGHTIHSDSKDAIYVQQSGTVTIKGEGAVISETNNALLILTGKVILEGGKFTSRKENFSSVYMATSEAELFVTGENVTISPNANSIGLGVYDAKKISLSAGTYSGLENTIIVSDKFTLGDLLGHTDRDRYAFYNGDQPVTGILGEKQLGGEVTIRPCNHAAAEYVEQEGTDQHQRNCPACGDTTVFDCVYGDYGKVDGQNHKGVCICGREDVRPHEWNYKNSGGESAKEIIRSCSVCSSEELVGTVSVTDDFTVPYGGTKGHVLEVTANPSDLVLENMKWSCEGTGAIDADTSTCSLPEDLAADVYPCEFTASCFGNEMSLLVKVTVAPAPLTADMVMLSAESVVYDGSECRPIVWVPGLTEGTDFEIAYSSFDFTNAGTVTITVTGKGNYQGVVEKAFTIEPAGLRAKGSGVADGEYGTRLSDLTVSGLTAVTEWGQKEIAGTWKFTDDRIPDAGDRVPYTARFQPAAGADNYKLLEAEAAVTIRKKQGILTVPQTEIGKTFGDAEFSLGAAADGDGVISYASDNEAVAKVSGQGNVTVHGAGKAVITVSLAEGRNYTSAPDQSVRISVEKAAAPILDAETRNYTSAAGSDGEVQEDVAARLPANRGQTAYTVRAEDADGILSDISVDQNGSLAYTVKGHQAVGSKALLTVTAEMGNYRDAVFTLQIEVVEKIQVEITAQPQNSVYNGMSQNGFTQLSGRTVNGSYTGDYEFLYEGTKTAYHGSEPPAAAGTYTVTIRVPDDEPAYTGASQPVLFTIEKSAVTIHADDQTARTGDPLPKLTCTVSGLAGQDRLAREPRLTCDADMRTAGSYIIVVSGAQVPDTDNYKEEIVYENGMLTVSGTNQGDGTGSPGSGSGSSGTGGTGSPGSGSGSSGTGGSGSSSGTGGSSGDMGGNLGGIGSPGSGFGSTGSGTGSSRQPFLKDSSGRQGWDVIRAAIQKTETTQPGETIAVDMNSASVVPGSILTGIRGRDVTLAFDLGGGIVWNVNGKNLTAETVGDTDFSVRPDAGKIPADLAVSRADGEAYLYLSLAHEGTFGFTAELSIQLGSVAGNITAAAASSAGSAAAEGYAGMYANLFYYNPALHTLEFVCAGKIGEDGTAHLPFAHASDYLLVLSAQPLNQTDASQDTSGSGEGEQPEKPQEPDADIHVPSSSVRLLKTVYTYNGKAKKPSVIVTGKDGRRISANNYSVRYKNNRKAGKATVIVTFQNGYSGTLTKTFTIRPAGASIKKLTALPGGFAVKWAAKDTQADGYQIQYSRSSAWKGKSVRTVSVKKASAWKKNVKDLQAGKNYYVRIRSYKIVKTGGKNKRVYSAWNRAGRVKTL